ncbi:hypothetical protein [Mesorhizobium sp. M7A.F.Ca.US.008.03.1.1]|uniref:hypothetical protein n=1 Tax=Mesorhizobium sp. M7A.F.Ca.US.008.03.1.1 TaxID=2496742 RepID=UPI000FCABCA9|nr:hypothetical protein [Mesorhizobium sp. M7A.F.Ca.US.008.03.1.1]RUW62127.1 hypothetical protein EOA16_10345 [Mesorhizobium sp. M7A.F.Ca.US.008.03.1.1]
MSSLMTFAEYAQAIGVNASTVSRGVKNGTIPVVELADGQRKIDRSAADSARRLNGNIARGHGGRADRAVRRQAEWKAKSETGYEPSVLAMLNAMRTLWPPLMKQSMGVLGAAEIDQARAVLALSQMTAYIAAMVHQESSRVRDYRQVLQPETLPTFENEKAQAFYLKWCDHEGDCPAWTDEAEADGLPGGMEVAELMCDAGHAARP